MKVAIVKERRAPERRVAASPDSVKHMIGLGLEPVELFGWRRAVSATLW